MARVVCALLLLTVVSLSRGNNRPNFVFFVADDLGIGDVGCFGNDTIRTPNIDSIAANGAKLTQHLAATAVCTPSRAAFLTGRYPVRYGLAGRDGPAMIGYLSSPIGLPRSEVTFVQLAKDHGYRTALLGKWHLGLNCEWRGDHCHHPNKFGFDYFYGLPVTNYYGCDPDYRPPKFAFFMGGGAAGMYIRLRIWQIAMGVFVGFLALAYFRYIRLQWKTVLLLSIIFWTIVNVPFFYIALTFRRFNCILMRDNDVVEQPFDLPSLTPKMTLETVKFLEERKSNNEPFLLEVSYWNPHTDLLPAKEFRGKSRHGRYGDSVEEMDWSIGVVMETLDRLGLTDNTFVYFTSDNGGHIELGTEGGWNGNYKGGKTQGGYEGGIRMPTLVQWPRKIKPGTVVSETTSQMDIFPTVADIIRAPLPQDRVVDGRSILPLLGGATGPSPHDFLFHYCGGHVQAVRYRPREGNVTWKAHFISPKWDPGTTTCGGPLQIFCPCGGPGVTHNDPPLLYDITDDPTEDRPIRADSDPKYQKVINTIKKAVDGHLEGIGDVENLLTPLGQVPRPWLQECCNFPYCNCREDVDLSSLQIDI